MAFHLRLFFWSNGEKKLISSLDSRNLSMGPKPHTCMEPHDMDSPVPG